MYEKILGYFERNLCLENIYFRKHCLKWFVGIALMIIIEISVCILFQYININFWHKFILQLLIFIIINCIGIYFIYIKHIIKIFEEKVGKKLKIDIIGILSKEEILGAYEEIQINEIEKFLVNECRINKVETIDYINSMIDREINDKYTNKNFSEKILPVIIFMLTAFFANNNNIQSFEQIFFFSIIIILALYACFQVLLK